VKISKGAQKARLQGSEEEVPKQKKRLCYNYGSTKHFIAHCPHEIKDNNYKRQERE
jgi:hypothetical protein